MSTAGWAGHVDERACITLYRLFNKSRRMRAKMLDPRLVDATSLPKMLPWICSKRAATAGNSFLIALGYRLAMTRVPCVLSNAAVKHSLSGTKDDTDVTE